MKLDAKGMEKLHLILMGAWGVLFIPTTLYWKESVTWVVFMSWYANWVGHWSSYQAAHGEKKQAEEPTTITPEQESRIVERVVAEVRKLLQEKSGSS